MSAGASQAYLGAETGRRATALRDVLLSPTADLGTDMLVAGIGWRGQLRPARSHDRAGVDVALDFSWA